MWLLDRHAWSYGRVPGHEHLRLADILAEFVSAEDVGTAERCYQRLDNHVVLQGLLYEAAVPTAEVVSAALVAAHPSARPVMLLLLVELCARENNPGEAPGRDLRRECMQEVVYAFSVLQNLLETCNPGERPDVIDLLGFCAEADARLRSRTHFLLTRAGQVHKGDQYVQRVVQAWLSELTD